MMFLKSKKKGKVIENANESIKMTFKSTYLYPTKSNYLNYLIILSISEIIQNEIKYFHCH